MKKATRKTLTDRPARAYGMNMIVLDEQERDDILDSDKKQRARIRDLEARLKAIAEVHAFDRRNSTLRFTTDNEVRLALDLSNKSWRKGGGK